MEKILSIISSIGIIIVSFIFTMRMIGEVLSVNPKKEWLKVLLGSKEKELLYKIKEKIDEIKLKDDNLQKLNAEIDKTITKIYEELFVLLGITRDELKSLVKQYLFEKKTNENISKDPLKKLILLLARCTYKFGREVTYGTETPINTKYYIIVFRKI